MLLVGASASPLPPVRTPVAPASPAPGTSPQATPTPTPTSPPTSPPTWTAPPGTGFGITGLAPAAGATTGGTRVTITGTQIPGGAAVLFGGVPATVLAQRPGAIEVETPAAAAGVVDIEVIGDQIVDFSVERANVLLQDAFTYTSAPAPGSGSAPGSTPAPGASPTAAAPAATPSVSGTPTPGTGVQIRGGLTLNPARDIDATVFGLAPCKATCTALRW